MDKITFKNDEMPYLNAENLNQMQDNIERAIGQGGGGGVSGDTLPIGAIIPFSSDNIPTNWLLCDGKAISRTKYAQLFDVIGTKYGPGDGSNTFNLPNFKGRVAVGKDTNDTDFNDLNKKGGEKTHTLTIDEMPSHTHKVNEGATTMATGGSNDLQQGTGNRTYTHLNVQKTGESQPHNNVQPYIVTNYIIKAFQSAGLVADVAHSETDSDTDVYSCNYINNIKSILDKLKVQENYIQATTTTALNLGSGTKIKLNSLMYLKGNVFSLDSVNNQIVVGKGVSKVEISASIFAENTGSTGYIWAIIKLANKGNVIGAIHAAGDDWGFLSSTVPSSVVAVSEGDRIELIADSTTGGTNRTGGLNVWIYVKALE